VLDALRAEIFFVFREGKLNLAHLKRVLYFFAEHLIWEGDENFELGICCLVIQLDYKRLQPREVFIVGEFRD